MNDTITCPISGKVIGPGEGEAIISQMGNMWIVHPSVPNDERRLDVKDEGLETIKGHRPLGGPHALVPNEGI